MTRRPGILFPHTYITRRDLELVLAHFGPLTIYQPWFMEDPVPGVDHIDVSLVRIKNPPEDLRPGGDFGRLVSEYQLWMSQNQDKGYATYLSTSFEKALSEDTPWEIRQMVRQMDQDPIDPSYQDTVKWHITLHLARQLEENRTRVEELLQQLRQEGSPLAGAIEEGVSSNSLFKDLPREESYPLVEKHRIRQVLEAWFGLFGEYLTDHDPLITLNGYVMDYITEMFEERGPLLPKGPGESGPQELGPGQVEVFSKDLPEPSENQNRREDPVLSHLYGKTITLLQGRRIA